MNGKETAGLFSQGITDPGERPFFCDPVAYGLKKYRIEALIIFAFSDPQENIGLVILTFGRENIDTTQA